MMIFKSAIPRRAFLRGLGVTIALPLLDAMVPALASSASTKAPVRLGFTYVPNGMWPMEKWTPKTEGSKFELPPTLEPLTPYRDQLLVLSGLAHKEAIPTPGDGGGDHSRACATWLTGVRPVPTAGKDFRAGISVDQVIAQERGKDTQLASLEVSLASTELVGTCETNWSCAYLGTLSWRTPTTPLPMENNPRALFERLLGDTDSTDRAQYLSRIREQRSILDQVSKRASELLKDIGPGDRLKITEYLDAIRDIERRIQLAEKQSDRELPRLDKPIGVPAKYDDYAKLMIDMQVLAFQADLTRVATFLMGREGPFGSRAYPEIGIADLHHSMSHHQNEADKIDKLFRINLYHMKVFSYFLQKLRSTPDGDGSLLDHSLLLYGSGLSNGNTHQHDNLPLLIVGGAGGQLTKGSHIRYPDGTPMTNLHLTILSKVGLPVEKFGDSAGKLEVLGL